MTTMYVDITVVSDHCPKARIGRIFNLMQTSIKLIKICRLLAVYNSTGERPGPEIPVLKLVMAYPTIHGI